MSEAIVERSIFGFPIRKTLMTALIAGAVSLTVWEIWAKVFAPFYMGGGLSPIGLVKSSLGIGKETFGPLGAAKSGAVGTAVANGIHILTGLLAFPLGYIIGARPISRAVMPQLPWYVTGAVYGVVLYIFGMYVMAHLFAGLPPFLGFSALSQASLVGHTLLGIAIAYVVNARDGTA